MVGRFVSGLGGFGFFRADGAEGGEDFVVYCLGMVYYCADNSLDAFDSSVI